MILNRLQNYLGLVRFSHTLFALPFALMGALVAADGLPTLWVSCWIVICMVMARTSAMTFNRIVDRRIDANNPRTKDRHIPAGKVSLWEAIVLWIIASQCFIIGAWFLNHLAFMLSPVALVIICGYSYFKRFSSISHFVLGLSLGIAPVGAWIAVQGEFALPPMILALGVLAWVSGFDVIYALMDEAFDRKEGLHSLVVSLGRDKALKAAFALHVLSIICIAGFGWLAGLGWIYGIGVIGFAALIIYEHSLIKPDDTTRVNIAFFNVNGIISIGLFCFTLVDLFWV